MVYGSLSLISFLLFLKSYGAVAQCPGCLELMPPGSNIPSTAYIQPVGQVCFPAVIQIPDNTPQNIPAQPTPPRDEDDDYLNLIYLLISALTGSNKCNSNSNSNFNSNNNGRNSYSQNNGPSPIFNPLSTLIPNSGNNNPGPSSGYIDITSLSNGPYSYPSPNPSPIPSSNSNPNPITISIDTSGASTGCICEACNLNNPFANLNLFPGFAPGLGYGPSSVQNNNNAQSSTYIPDSFNAGNGCIYVPYPVPVPYNVPGYNFDDICYPENEYGPQEIKLIINTQCD